MKIFFGVILLIIAAVFCVASVIGVEDKKKRESRK